MKLRALVYLLFGAVIWLPACDRVDNRQHVSAIQELTASAPDWVDDDRLGRQLWGIEQQFYESRGHVPAWIDGSSATAHLTELIAALRGAEAHGLDPGRYDTGEFEALVEQNRARFRGSRFDPEIVPELDAKLTFAYLRYASDLLGWGDTPRQVFQHWMVEAKDEDLAARLASAIADGTIAQSLETLAPSHPQYKGLQAAVRREREQPTGEGNLERLLMNLERWRWAPRDLGERYILVNVPMYQLQVMEADTPVLTMKTIVGSPATPTPLFSDEMSYVAFSPYWNIPQSIATGETLPSVARDPDFLLRNNIELVDTNGEVVDPWSIDWTIDLEEQGLRFRQRPGAGNALGLVKFMFPNRFNVYLHDTPGDHLFARNARALSHGCVRVADPVALAEYVLRDDDSWTRDRITEAMHAEREQSVPLERKLPVHIGYWTAWVAPDGTVTVTDDPYGIDRAHARVRAR